MAVEVPQRPIEPELHAHRRQHRDAAAITELDKASILAHLRAQLAELRASQEGAHGDA